MFKFGQIQVNSKDFYAQYQITDIYNIDFNKIVISEGVLANKQDMRYTIGYQDGDNNIIPLFIKTPKNCHSSGVSRYSETSAWTMSYKIEDPQWVQQYEGIFSAIELQIFGKLEVGAFKNSDKKYINPKLIAYQNKIKTSFNELPCPFDIYCDASGVLKIGSVYYQGSNKYLQIYVKECRYKEKDINFESQLSDDDEEFGLLQI